MDERGQGMRGSVASPVKSFGGVIQIVTPIVWETTTAVIDEES